MSNITMLMCIIILASLLVLGLVGLIVYITLRAMGKSDSGEDSDDSWDTYYKEKYNDDSTWF